MLEARVVLLELSGGRRHIPMEFSSSYKRWMVPRLVLRTPLRMVFGRVLGIGLENRPSKGTCHSKYTCLTASGNSKGEIKRIRKLTGACKPICRTLPSPIGPFAPDTARIESNAAREY